MSVTPEQVQRIYEEADCLFSREAVERAIEQMAAAISDELAQKDPLILAVMSGAMIPAGVLLTHLDFPLQIDYIHATRYRGDTAGGEIEWRVAPRFPLKGRCVLVIDDILDEGLTLQAIIDTCRKEGASEVRSAVLVKKRHARNIGIEADYVGLEVEDRYVFGYGMDYKEYLRNAPGIFAVRGS
ncbi:MAG: hypoxanthine-guanine phosphoribosyltransferase [Gammaproteobacteria bacterium]|nr:hypoxanthine-guanine phosphoribosyltransferase [Gammaproteobacteria bacterium]